MRNVAQWKRCGRRQADMTLSPPGRYWRAKAAGKTGLILGFRKARSLRIARLLELSRKWRWRSEDHYNPQEPLAAAGCYERRDTGC